jgi:hypothetical protein
LWTSCGFFCFRCFTYWAGIWKDIWVERIANFEFGIWNLEISDCEFVLISDL